jgi:hypothetical protein
MLPLPDLRQSAGGEHESKKPPSTNDKARGKSASVRWRLPDGGLGGLGCPVRLYIVTMSSCCQWEQAREPLCPRHRAGREGRERSAGHGGPPLGAGQDRPRVHRHAKANPGRLNMASAGIGGPQHIAGELFKFMAGVDLTHIPYKGSTPAVTDLVAGQVRALSRYTLDRM